MMAFFAQFEGDVCAAGCGRIHPGDYVTWDANRRLVHVMCDHPTGEVEAGE